MKELMIHVERIVRPLRGDLSKLRMRRELLAHLQAAYDQERSAGRSPDDALAEAKRRLGDPASLATELQASMPWYETLGTTPFPRWLSVICWTAALFVPLWVGALIVLPAVPFPARRCRCLRPCPWPTMATGVLPMASSSGRTSPTYDRTSPRCSRWTIPAIG